MKDFKGNMTPFFIIVATFHEFDFGTVVAIDLKYCTSGNIGGE